MNENFVQKIKETNKSIYKISQESGIPYTTLNELYNGKKDINNTSSETVYKLSLYFKCGIQDLLNESAFLENSKGSYMGMNYQWIKTDKGIELHADDDGTDVTLITLKKMCSDLYDSYIHQVPEMMIEEYVEDKQDWEALL